VDSIELERIVVTRGLGGRGKEEEERLVSRYRVPAERVSSGVLLHGRITIVSNDELLKITTIEDLNVLTINKNNKFFR
jgi:hypothetical protein